MFPQRPGISTVRIPVADEAASAAADSEAVEGDAAAEEDATMMTQCWWHSGGHSRTGGSKLLRWRRCFPRRGWWCLDPTDPAAPRRPFAHIPAICCRLLHIFPQHCMHQSQHTSHTLRVAGVGYDFISSSSASIALTLTCLLDFFGIGCKHEVFRSGSSR